MATLPEHIENLIANFTPSQKLYCEYRARGLSQAGAALKAGSTAKADNLRVQGHQWENLPGSKEYIEYLKQQHAQAGLIDAAEIIQKLRKVYDEAIATGSLKDANKAAELLGTMIGVFGRNNVVTTNTTNDTKSGIHENVNAFKDEDDDSEGAKDNLTKLIRLAQSTTSNSDDKK